MNKIFGEIKEKHLAPLRTKLSELEQVQDALSEQETSLNRELTQSRQELARLRGQFPSMKDMLAEMEAAVATLAADQLGLSGRIAGIDDERKALLRTISLLEGQGLIGKSLPKVTAAMADYADGKLTLPPPENEDVCGFPASCCGHDKPVTAWMSGRGYVVGICRTAAGEAQRYNSALSDAGKEELSHLKYCRSKATAITLSKAKG